MKFAKFPDESRSRRPGWTEGESIILADRKPWHLPTIDDALIPRLFALVPIGQELGDYVGMLGRGEIHPGDLASENSLIWFRMFLMALLRSQYKNRDGTLERLIALDDPSMVEALYSGVLAYLVRMDRFVGRRVPIGSAAARERARWN